MRNVLVFVLTLLSSASPAFAQVSVGIGLPGVSIGVNLPVYPELVRVPNYPVYFAPRLNANFFFYDGLYWVYRDDNWYASSWYNGPWGLVGRQSVPLYVLRVPVRYYRQPPSYFQGWRPDAPPQWGRHWGHEWERDRRGWDKWDRRSAPGPAPLPVYQRGYSGDRYPQQVDRQHAVRDRNYRYQPRETVARQHFQAHAAQRAAPPPQPQQRQEAPRRSEPQQRPHGAAQGEHVSQRGHDRGQSRRGDESSQDRGQSRRRDEASQESARDHGQGRDGGDRVKGDGRRRSGD